jgi:hypothetical protein
MALPILILPIPFNMGYNRRHDAVGLYEAPSVDVVVSAPVVLVTHGTGPPTSGSEAVEKNGMSIGLVFGLRRAINTMPCSGK